MASALIALESEWFDGLANRGVEDYGVDEAALY